MTEPSEPDGLLDDAEMERLLSLIVNGESPAFPERAMVRERMLLEFQRHQGPTDHPEPESLSDAPVELIEFEAMTSRAPHPLSRRWAMAAAVLVVVGFGVAIAFGIAERWDDPATIEVATVDTSRFVSEIAQRPIALPSGEHRTEAVGGGIWIRVADGIEVLEERDGRVVLGLEGDESQPRALVTILDVSDQGTVEEQLDDPELEGLIVALDSVAVTGEGFVPEWELRLTNDAIDRLGCRQAGPCFPFGDIELWSQGTNVITEIQGPNGQTIWWVEQSSARYDQFLTRATEILGTLRFG